jgi:hypothetical protein
MKVDEKEADGLLSIRFELAKIVTSLQVEGSLNDMKGKMEIQIAIEHLKFAIEEIDDTLLERRRQE